MHFTDTFLLKAKDKLFSSSINEKQSHFGARLVPAVLKSMGRNTLKPNMCSLNTRQRGGDMFTRGHKT